jgi:hypothetical protein
MFKVELKPSKMRYSASRWVSVAAVFLLVLSGCSFGRVSTAKKQFCDFDNNFSYSLSGRPELVFANPVFLASDVKWVIGYQPTHIQEDKSDIVHSYVFEKVGGAESESSNFHFDLHYQQRGDDTVLKSIQFPPQITSLEQFKTIDFAGEIAASADTVCNYSVGFSMPSLEEDIDPAMLEALPSRAEVIGLLGPPSSELDDGALVYDYQVRGQVEEEPAMRAVIWYDETGTKPLRMESKYRFMGSRADFVQGKIHHFYSG